MARPERNNVDYFPFFCEEGRKMYYIEETYGNDGFTVFVKLLRELAKTDYHYLNLSDETTVMFLSARCKVTKEVLESVIIDLVKLGKFNKMLWEENRIIWCQDFIDSIQDAYIKRKNKCISFDDLLHLLVSLGVRKRSKSGLKGGRNTQSKVEYSKEEETKVDKIIYPFDSKKFLDKWKLWKDYRIEIKKPIKGIISEQSALKKISELANYSDDIACKIIDQSISNNWQGLFELKNFKDGKQNSKSTKEKLSGKMEDYLNRTQEG